MVAFAGWAMPVQYAGIMDEARAVRTSVGLFDVSHMGRLCVIGAGSEVLLQSATTNDVSRLSDGRAMYSLITGSDGGILDDVIIYRRGPQSYLVVVNAGNTARDYTWFAHRAHDCIVVDTTTSTAMVAVQGPHALGLVQRVLGIDVSSLPRFAFIDAGVCGTTATVCRTGYTGEDGVELIVPCEAVGAVWVAILSAGAVPCGLGARDVLRVEAGYPLYGHEIDEATTPVEAGLMWAVSLSKGKFEGRDAIESRVSAGPDRRLVGIEVEGRVVPRPGYRLLHDGRTIGHVTSGAVSPMHSTAIGMAYVRPEHSRPGTAVMMEVRGAEHLVAVAAKKDLLRR